MWIAFSKAQYIHVTMPHFEPMLRNDHRAYVLAGSKRLNDEHVITFYHINMSLEKPWHVLCRPACSFHKHICGDSDVMLSATATAAMTEVYAMSLHSWTCVCLQTVEFRITHQWEDTVCEFRLPHLTHCSLIPRILPTWRSTYSVRRRHYTPCTTVSQT